MSTGKAASRRAEERAAEDRKLALQAVTDSKTPGYFEQRAIDDNKAYNTWKEGHDYRTPAPGMISLGYGDAAQRRRMREREIGAVSSGLAGLSESSGGANATALGMAKLKMADENDQDTADSYERGVQAEDTFQRTGAPTWAGLGQNRMGMVTSALTGMYSNDAQLAAALRPQSLWPSIISGGLAAAGAALGNPAGLSNLWGGRR